VQIKHANTLNQLSKNRLNQQITQLISANKKALIELNHRLKNAVIQLVNQQKNQLANHAHALGHLSPLSTLSRGYSITIGANQKLLTSVNLIQTKQLIQTRLSDGVIYSKVEKIEKN
jgi:exodeoxyribonuclease VII large subunit